MLFTPPPGYNPSAVNAQNVGSFNVPGQQGGTAQGYLGNLYRSSYHTPSSFSVPSSVNVPNPFYQQQGQPGQQSPQNQMAKLLRGG
jgi:hypothetical protein